MALHAIFKLADIFAGTLSDLFTTPKTLASFFLQVRLGQVFLWQIIAGLLIAVAGQVAQTKRHFQFVLALALISLLPSALTGHSGGLQFHQLAVTSWGIHIVSISLWTAGVLALLFVAVSSKENLQRGFSVISRTNFVCYFFVVTSGAVNAWLRIPSWSSLIESPYGRLLIAKILIFVLLGILGALIRLRFAQGSVDNISRALSVELFLMGLAIMLGVLLSSTKFPIGIPK